MIEQIYAYFTIEILYFWVNLGVLPFWLILIFFPQSNLSGFVTIIFFISSSLLFIQKKSPAKLGYLLFSYIYKAPAIWLNRRLEEINTK